MTGTFTGKVTALALAFAFALAVFASAWGPSPVVVRVWRLRDSGNSAYRGQLLCNWSK